MGWNMSSVFILQYINTINKFIKILIVVMNFTDGSDGKESACSSENLDSIPGWGRSLGEGKVTHSSVLAWSYISWTEEAARLQSMGSQRGRHKESDKAEQLTVWAGSDSRVCLQRGRPGFDPWVGKIPWRWQWQSIPVFLPGDLPGQRSLVGYSPWGHTELDTTK